MKDIEFFKKFSSLSEEKQKEVVRLVDFAFEEGRIIREQYGLDREPHQLAGKSA